VVRPKGTLDHNRVARGVCVDVARIGQALWSTTEPRYLEHADAIRVQLCVDDDRLPVPGPVWDIEGEGLGQDRYGSSASCLLDQ